MELFALALLLIVLITLGFALYGLGVFLQRIFGSGEPLQTSKPKDRSIDEDVIATCFLLNELYRQGAVDERQYQLARQIIESRFTGTQSLPKRIKKTAAQTTAEQPVTPSKQAVQILPGKSDLEKPGAKPDHSVTPKTGPTRHSRSDQNPSQKTSQPEFKPTKRTSKSEAGIVQPEVVTGVSFSPPPADLESRPAPIMVPAAATTRPAPWDLPDPPEAPPRRSFGEIMSGFMEDKNIRWGELASGILIVGSAVGLVVSLRNELKDTIPYFSALMFMLITAAIHGAGIYTLKKWNLRNTSRGALIIGLLLIPLNFLAGCILAGNGEMRRELSDPLLWSAVIVGISSFSMLAWWSSKLLLRRGNLPMVIGIIGCGIGTLLINRLDLFTQGSFGILALALPLLVSFVVATAFFYQRQWIRVRWPERATRRLFVFLGIALFSVLMAGSLIIVRAPQKMSAIVSLTPALIVVFLMMAWQGSIIWRGAAGRSENSNKLSGLTIHILGLILTLTCVLASLTNATMFLISGLVVAVGVVAMSIHQRSVWILPVAWTALSGSVLAGLHLANGNFGWDSPIGLQQALDAIVGGQSGLCLLATGMIVFGLNLTVARFHSDSEQRNLFTKIGGASAGSIVLAGCLLAVIASFINRYSVFDTMTASALLGIASIGFFVLVTVQRWSQPNHWAPILASLFLLAGLLHSILWNPVISDFVAGWTLGTGANWLLIAVLFGAINSAAAAVLRWKQKAVEQEYRQKFDTIEDYVLKSQSGEFISSEPTAATLAGVESFGITATFGNLIASGGVFFVVSQLSGFGSVVSLVMVLAWWLLAWSQHDLFRGSNFWAGSLKIATAIVPMVLLIELGTRFGWIAEFSDPKHWFVQVIVLCGWSIGWNAINISCERRGKMGWLFAYFPRADHLLLMLAAIVVCGFTAAGLTEISTKELALNSVGTDLFSISEYVSWIVGALVASMVAIAFAIFARPSEGKATILIVVWLVAWSLIAVAFEASGQSGAAIRWFVTLGGLIGSLLIGFRHRYVATWDAVRESVGLRAPHRWPVATTQVLINIGLCLVVGVVLTISTVVISKFMIYGAESFPKFDAQSWLSRIPKDVSYAVPVGFTVASCLVFAISERRKWLALAGSTVFQYFVALGLVLLFFANDPRIASSRFLLILQTVSIGMTIYGFCWYWFRDRIEPKVDGTVQQGWMARNHLDAIGLHTLVNGVLILSLATLIIVRFFRWPVEPGDWVNTAGGPLGLVALIAFGGLATAVWSKAIWREQASAVWSWLVCGLGLSLVAILASTIDQYSSLKAWMAFRTIMWGSVLVSGLVGWIAFRRVRPLLANRGRWIDNIDVLAPVLLPGLIVVLFALRGGLSDRIWFPGYLSSLGAVTAIIVVCGLAARAGWIGFVAIATTLVFDFLLVSVDPLNWFQASIVEPVSLMMFSVALVGLIWVIFYIWKRKTGNDPKTLQRSFVAMPNLVVLLGSVFVFLLAVVCWQNAIDVVTPIGISAIASVLALSIVNAWNDRQQFRILTRCLLSLGLAILIISQFVPTGTARWVWIVLASSACVVLWSMVWLNRHSIGKTAHALGVRRIGSLKQAMSKRLRVYGIALSLLLLPISIFGILTIEHRMLRYLIAFVPGLLAVGWGCFSDEKKWRGMQQGSLALTTVAAVFVAWADSSPELLMDSWLNIAVRTLLVLAGAMFVYGGLVARWLREGDSWTNSLREAAYVTCGLALVCLGVVVWQEAVHFVPGQGSGISVAQAIGVAAVVVGMIYGLISIAVRPERDPFSFSLAGRKGYVYAAQVVGIVLVAHIYFAMPWLFDNGIVQKFWPYVAMLITFGGVALARLFEKRNLEVLREPVFNSAAVLPVAVAIAIWFVDSQADASVVMLVIGMAYLMICYTHQSFWSGAAAVVSGNIALWLFYQKFPGFSFFEHPQLWLIPPAVSTLIAAQILRKKLTAANLGLLRYVSVAVIYISSTSEVFIHGIGDALWPPMILALMAVAGIMLGIMMRIRAFLYLGSLFLFMAIVVMVSHAQQRLEHVWPWWVFGIGLGVSILLMFGLFEKKRNELRAFATQFKEWDL